MPRELVGCVQAWCSRVIVNKMAEKVKYDVLTRSPDEKFYHVKAASEMISILDSNQCPRSIFLQPGVIVRLQVYCFDKHEKENSFNLLVLTQRSINHDNAIRYHGHIKGRGKCSCSGTPNPRHLTYGAIFTDIYAATLAEVLPGISHIPISDQQLLAIFKHLAAPLVELNKKLVVYGRIDQSTVGVKADVNLGSMDALENLVLCNFEYARYISSEEFEAARMHSHMLLQGNTSSASSASNAFNLEGKRMATFLETTFSHQGHVQLPILNSVINDLLKHGSMIEVAFDKCGKPDQPILTTTIEPATVMEAARSPVSEIDFDALSPSFFQVTTPSEVGSPGPSSSGARKRSSDQAESQDRKRAMTSTDNVPTGQQTYYDQPQSLPQQHMMPAQQQQIPPGNYAQPQDPGASSIFLQYQQNLMASGSSTLQPIVQIGSDGQRYIILQQPVAGTSGLQQHQQVPVAGTSGVQERQQVPVAGASGLQGYQQVPVAGTSGVQERQQVPVAGASGLQVYQQAPVAGTSGAQQHQQVPVAGTSGVQERQQAPVAGTSKTNPGQFTFGKYVCLFPFPAYTNPSESLPIPFSNPAASQ